MYTRTLRLIPLGDKFYIEFDTLYRADFLYEPELYTRKEAEDLLKENNYEFRYKSRFGNFERWAYPASKEQQ
jgi:hypothetical protein